MHALMQDVRFGFRQLLRYGGSSLIAVLTLSLGIGVSSALFSVIDAAMLRPLPYPNPEQLVSISVEVTGPDGSTSRPTPSMQDMRSWQEAHEVFSAVAGWGTAFRGRIVDGPEPQRLRVLHFTEDYLAMLGVTPVLGRAFTAEDCELRSPLVALLGYGYWQSRFGGRTDVLGQTIRLDEEVATIVGVLPPGFNPETPVSTPLRIPVNEFARRGTGRVSVEARLRPGVSLEDAAARLSARMDTSGELAGPARAVVESELDSTVSRYRTTINVFTAAVGLIVLIAAVNVAALLLARGAARQGELQVRASLGASRRRLVRQLLTETLVLSLPAGVLGVAIAWTALDALVANIPLSLPQNSPVTLNVRVLAATSALLLLTALAAGLLPGMRLSRVTVDRVLGRSKRHVGASLSRRGGQVFITAEVALAVVLVTGAALMLRSFARITAVDLGFNPERLVTMDVLPLVQGAGAQKEYYLGLLQQLRTVPSVSAAGAVDNFVLGGTTAYTTVASATSKASSSVFSVMPGYFETIGATVREGRLLTDADYAAGVRGVVINESASRALFRGVPALGRELTRPGSASPWTVLGVIADLRHGGPLNARGVGQPQVFFPYQPSNSPQRVPITVVARYTGAQTGMADQLRRVANSVGSRVLVEQVRSADELFTQRVLTPRRRTVLLTLLGALGLTLALVGVFGTTAHAVTRRTAEIGLRLAVGARPSQVVRTVMRDSVWPVAIGIAIGVGGALMLTRLIESFLFQTSPTDPATLGGVAVVLMMAGSLAALVPAFRAARVDPATTLRVD